jgi:hypothetical protein
MASLDLLKANAFLELALPDSAFYRWKKVFRRIQLFPTLHKKVTFKISNDFQMNEWVRLGLAFAKDRGLPIAGIHAARYYLGLPPDSAACLPHRARIQVLSQDPSTDAAMFAQLPFPTKISASRKSSFFAPEKVFVHLKINNTWHPWVSLHKVHSLCISVEKEFVSLFYLLYIEHLHMYRYGKSTLLPALVSRVSVKRFGVECFGQAPTLRNLLREQSDWKYSPI